ncbi:hypothetical protein C4J85_0291 [Pseudomonas sp. R4-34-07]|uniref:hypothetical protein n=1 Tax=unclassified Pseudomonas TaxID=196821 RepID=UPI000F55A3EE|nr:MULTISPECIES: hypothetical protein [unclassified Pseudomonas]AZF35117.1 hypothetical protein C4J88_0302 [Pseudomonas sp. R4-39-08]AZF50808.1 hypothetical protein C4J85_0291 [Pseudomonas sp. R4-34-07]
MNAEINPMYTRTFHPVRVDGDAIHALALWLKENGARQGRQQPDLRSVMSERYPAGLFTEDEVQVLCELERN